MTPLSAILRGIGAALSSPAMVLWLWVANVLVALPFAVLVTSSLESSIGGSLVHEKLRSGFDMGWYGEYEAQTSDVAGTFRPSVIGVGALLDNVESWLNGDFMDLPPALLAAGVAYLFLWAFLLGGVLERFRDRAGVFRSTVFFEKGSEFFFRFVRLALVSGVLYYLVYRFAGWLFTRIEDVTRDVTVEGTVVGYVVAASLLVGFLLTLVHMVFDYAKIATVNENRRSMVAASLRGLFFVLSHPGRCLSIYYGLGALVVVLVVVYALLAPGAEGASAFRVGMGFLIGQIYLVGKIVLRLSFYAGQTAFFQSSR